MKQRNLGGIKIGKYYRIGHGIFKAVKCPVISRCSHCGFRYCTSTKNGVQPKSFKYIGVADSGDRSAEAIYASWFDGSCGISTVQILGGVFELSDLEAMQWVL